MNDLRNGCKSPQVKRALISCPYKHKDSMNLGGILGKIDSLTAPNQQQIKIFLAL